MKNPLLQPFSSAFKAFPFKKTNANHFLPAIENQIEHAKEEINKICNNSESPTFENTVEALSPEAYLTLIVPRPTKKSKQ
jgi:Zn-dependent oligopeptidase